MKKRYRIALAACMTAAALTACQGKAAEPDASAAVSEKTGTGASETKEKKQGEKESSGVFESFTAQDLDGNQVDETIFEDAELTMINVWGTFCTPCLEEMPDLAELNREYQEKGVRSLESVLIPLTRIRSWTRLSLRKPESWQSRQGRIIPISPCLERWWTRFFRR